MDIKLAKEIYSGAWLIDHITFNAYMNILNDYRAGAISTPEQKLNSFTLYDLQSKQKLIKNNWDLDELEPEEEAISIIKLDGPITKNGGASHYGTKELSEFLTKADSKEGVKGHILQINSGGGAANAVEILANAITNAEKPVVAHVEDMMASAAMYIGSYSDYIISNSEQDLIGSIGTMIEFAGYPAKNENKETGLRNVRIYATKSTKKNNEFEQAINEFDFEPIKSKILDPTNERFLKDISNNRPVKEEQLTGEIFNASEVVGSLIDEIGNFETAINKINQLNSEMGLFSKEKPLNKVALNGVECVYQGELKTGTELTPIGENKLENGVYELDGQNYTIENGKVENIEKTPEVSYTQEQLDEAVTPLNAKIEEQNSKIEELTEANTALEAEKVELQNKVTELENLRSGHEAPKKDAAENETEKPKDYKSAINEVQNRINKVN
jgi:ClpP class serine protease